VIVAVLCYAASVTADVVTTIVARRRGWKEGNLH